MTDREKQIATRRAAGETWATIGAALGLSDTGARKAARHLQGLPGKRHRPQRAVRSFDHTRIETRAHDLKGRCPKCHLLYPADCEPGRCMARVRPWDQLEAIRRLFVAMNQNEGRQDYNDGRRETDNLARRARNERRKLDAAVVSSSDEPDAG